MIRRLHDRYYDELHQRLQLQIKEMSKRRSYPAEKEKNCTTTGVNGTQAQLESITELNGAMKDGSGQEALLIKKQVVDDVKRIK